MENIKPYNKYKPSGIAWLGDIPEHWERWKISRGVKNIGSGTTPSSGNKDFYENGTINWLNTGDFNNGILFKCKKKVTSKALQENSSLKLFPKGTLSVAMYGATIGKVCIIQFDATTNQACCNIVEGKIFDNKFLMYWFIGHKPHIVNLSYGGGQPNISQDVIKSLFVPCPIKSEQTAIANFLDYKTAKIDRFIRKKKQLIKLLNEQKAGIINHAVTRGLDPDAKLKDSGIEWLGDIPEHWEIVKLTGVCGFARGNSSFKKDELLSNGKYVALQYGKTYKVNEVDEKYQFYVNDEFYKVSQIVNYGDVIFISTSETIEDLGHSVFYNRSDLGLLGGEQILLKPKNDIVNGKYLCYSSKIFAKELKKYATGVKVFRFNINDLKTIYISVPPIQEQTAIVAHIEKETSIITKTIATIEKEIALTQEYRTALIAEAVTGKIDVRAFVIPTVSPQEELYEEIEDELDMVAEDAESYENE